MRTVYVNGDYLPENEATVSIFDRGFLMADGVYEVTSVLGGKLIDFDGHAVRLQRSLDALDMASPIGKQDLLEVHRELVRANGIEEGMVYLQITRGAPDDRDFVFPDPETTPPTIVRGGAAIDTRQPRVDTRVDGDGRVQAAEPAIYASRNFGDDDRIDIPVRQDFAVVLLDMRCMTRHLCDGL